jgi:hypothetical protein
MFWKKKEEKQYKEFVLTGREAREVKERFDFWVNTNKHGQTASFDLWELIFKLVPQILNVEDYRIIHTRLTVIITDRPYDSERFLL